VNDKGVLNIAMGKRDHCTTDIFRSLQPRRESI